MLNDCVCRATVLVCGEHSKKWCKQHYTSLTQRSRFSVNAASELLPLTQHRCPPKHYTGEHTAAVIMLTYWEMMYDFVCCILAAPALHMWLRQQHITAGSAMSDAVVLGQHYVKYCTNRTALYQLSQHYTVFPAGFLGLRQFPC